MKVCTDCKEAKHLNDFFKQKANKDGLRGMCKVCDNKKRKVHNAKDPERWQRNRRNTQLLHKYNITIEDYESLLKKQGGRCAICNGEQEYALYGTNKSLSLAVDHCHTTNKVRGLLCNNCNRGIGMLGDTAEALQRAVDYLIKT
jgi:hypothetical protein